MWFALLIPNRFDNMYKGLKHVPAQIPYGMVSEFVCMQHQLALLAGWLAFIRSYTGFDVFLHVFDIVLIAYS